MQTIGIPAHQAALLSSKSKEQGQKATVQPESLLVTQPGVSFGAKLPSAAALRVAMAPGLNQPQFGSISAPAGEASVLKALDELGVPEFADVLKEAKQLAREMNHKEVTSLHLMAVQFANVLVEAEQTDSQLDALDRMKKGERSIWNANVGPLNYMNSPQELAFHVKRLLGNIQSSLESLPTSSTPGQPKLSDNVMKILQNRIAQLQRSAPSEDEMKKQAQMMMLEGFEGDGPGGLPMGMGGMPPEVKGKVIKELKGKLQAAESKLAGVAPEKLEQLDQLFELFREQEEAFGNYMKLSADLAEIQAGRLPDMLVSMEISAPGRPPQVVRAPLNKIPREQIPQLLPSLTQSLRETISRFRPEVEAAWQEKQAEIAQIFGAEVPFNQLLSLIPSQQLSAYMEKQEMEMSLANLGEGPEPKSGNTMVADLKKTVARRQYDAVMVAAYDGKLEPRFLQDAPTAEAHRLYNGFFEMLSAGSYMEFESLEHYLQTAESLGAGDKQINTLTHMIGMAKKLKMEHMSESGSGPRGRGANDDDDDAGKMFRMKLLKQLNAFIRAYSNINWKTVETRQVNLEKASTLLNQEDLIPTPIKHQVMAFLKTGNRNNWQEQPLLLLVGDGASGMVKQAVVKTLSRILEMPISQPKGDLQSGIRLGGGRKIFRGEPSLSPFAQAVVENKTPASLMYIDNLLRFSIKGGEELFEQFASDAARKGFKEPDFDVPFDLSPFVMVVGVEDGYSGQYLSALHGDRFNDADMTIIELGEDIDTFTKEKVAERIARGLEGRFNVKFGPEVVKTICRDYAILGRHDYVETQLRQVAKAASGSVSTATQPVEIKVEDLETKWLGPKTSRSINNVMSTPTVGSINGLAAGGHGYGCVLRIGVSKQAEWLYDPRKDTGGRYSVRAALGPVTKMTEDSAKKAFESFMTDYLNNTVIGSDANKPYKLLQGLRHKAMSFQVVFPENVDGPSAGAAMASTAVSTVTGIPIRQDVAITGTIQDKGTVGPIGGIFGKTRAAFEAGVKTVVMPEVNYIELKKEHPRFCKEMENQGMKLVSVKTMDDVLKVVLTDYEALFKDPTPEQLAIDKYDPTGELKKQDDAGENRIRALVEEVVKANQAGLNATQTQLAEALKLIAQAFGQKPEGNS